ncbi:dTDP-4-dehydrorhamnose 3,5-epimerase [Streptomyces sp. PSKA54]|uniref:dTDP-4-dehydrorhamnose 3,5-epimerase n=1 Tax=Streptomyces himalayensis subsp. aureolus TaxID=2758039 RepID=A0A7W2HDY7_9ACTN|nr:dTDP-4-dehydrorhamnose 3,5-epimerase [Streptomyces himalayensis]MBA4860297.1 dTDP-4-dehydrorhamnose 3,5-epimerase [Streptomyces himalayensis subsp. aureolus]
MRPLTIEGAWAWEPRVFPDERGAFHEWFKEGPFHEGAGRSLSLAQANCSVSRRGVLRGIHYADVPPSQAKYVKCVRGAVLDMIVDIRVGSPTYKQWEAVRLDDVDHRSVFLAEGLGHAFVALSDEATVVYLCSTPYTPSREHGIHPLDEQLGIAWPEVFEPLLSAKDAEAPTLAEAERAGLLPRYEDCLALYASHSPALLGG